MGLIQKLLNFFLPNPCSNCGKLDKFSNILGICKKCLKENSNSSINFEFCENCETKKDFCDYCNSRNKFFEKLYFLREKNQFERDLIQKLKFKNEFWLSNFLSLNLNFIFSKLISNNYNSILYIDSSKSSIRKRPYHPCSGLIKRLKKKLKLKSFCPFQKISNELQSGKSYRDRFIHASKAFEIKKNYLQSFKGNYLLVDDLFTTGATVNELAKLLIQNGASKVDILVLLKGKEN